MNKNKSKWTNVDISGPTFDWIGRIKVLEKVQIKFVGYIITV